MRRRSSAVEPQRVCLAASPSVSPLQHLAQFCVECLRPDPDGATDLIAIHKTYRNWRLEALSNAALGKGLAELFDRAGLNVIERDGRMVVLGVSLRQPEHVIALSHGGRRLWPMTKLLTSVSSANA